MAYSKTNWENAPSTNTPINAGNLNKIEEGIYQNSLKTDQVGDLSTLKTSTKNTLVNAINELIPVVLFEDNNGEDGNITLEDTSANYKKLEIICKTTNNDLYTTEVLYEPNGKLCEIKTGNTETGLTDYYMFVVCTLSFNETSVTRANNRVVSLRNGNSVSVSTNVSYYNLLITKIVGYK